MAKQSKKDSKTTTPADEALDIDLTRSSSIPPPPDAPDALEMAVAAAAPVPEEVPTHSAVEPEAPVRKPSASDQGKVVVMGAKVDDSAALKSLQALADEVTAAVTAASKAPEVVVAPSAPSARLAEYQARFPVGGTFFMPGGTIGLTITDTPFELDGKIHAACVKHTGIVQFICIDGLLD